MGIQAAAPDRTHYNSDVLRSQGYIVDSFIIYLSAHRELIAINNDGLRRSQVLVTSSNANLLMAIIEWCKVFGSTRNKVHVSKIATETHPQDFCGAVCAALNMTSDEWDGYRQEMCAIRDKYIAHSDIDKPIPPVPLLDRAEDVAVFWESWVREVILPDQILETPLSEMAVRYSHYFKEEVSALSRCINDEDFPSAI